MDGIIQVTITVFVVVATLALAHTFFFAFG